MTAATAPVLIFGATGQLAREIARKTDGRLHDRPVIQLSRLEADLSDPEAIASAIRGQRPALVINAAAYTAVDKAETDSENAFIVNRNAPAVMAAQCGAIGIPLIHVSTDYVFDGTKNGPYLEDDPVAPLSAYGRSKEAGETAIRARCASHVILRTSWVFSAFGQNFVKTMLRLAGEREELSIVDDQLGGPTAAGDLADAVLAVATRLISGTGAFGTFHFQGAPSVTWRAFAEAVFAEAAPSLGRIPRVRPITTADYPTPAARPLNSALDCSRLLAAYGIAQPDWRTSLKAVIAELLSERQGDRT